MILAMTTPTTRRVALPGRNQGLGEGTGTPERLLAPECPAALAMPRHLVPRHRERRPSSEGAI